MYTRETRGPVLVLQPNNDILANQNINYSNTYSPPAKKLPTPPIKITPSSFGNVTANNSEKTINAQPKPNQNNQVPFTPYTGVNSNFPKPGSVSLNGASTLNSFNSKNSAVSTTPVSTVNNPLVFQNKTSPTINNSHNSQISTKQDVNLTVLLREHQTKKANSLANFKQGLADIKEDRKDLKQNWNKTSLGEPALLKAEQMFSTTEATIKNFRKEIKKSNPTDAKSLNEYIDRKNLLVDEINYIIAYTNYINYLKAGQKNVPIPVPPKVTLSSLAKPTSTKINTSTSSSTKITSNSPKILTFEEFNKRNKTDDILCHDENNGIYTSVSPDFSHLKGQQFINREGQVRIIRIRSVEEEKDIRAFLANAL